LEATVQELKATVQTQRLTIATLEVRVRELEAQLKSYSGNSSRPPSTDPPGAPPPAPPKRTGKRRGGQPGHPRMQHPLVPPEQVTRTQVLKPSQCRRCGKPLAGDDPEPHRHQVIDVPKVVATVEEYQLHTLRCEHCGVSTRATLPAGVPTTQFGPRLQAMVSLSSGDYEMSKRQIERFVEDTFEIPIALGSISNLEQSTSEAVAEPVEQLAQAIQEQPLVHSDETGWYECSRRAWLWVAITGTLALFLVHARRGAEVAKKLLGTTFAGILSSDRWSAYEWVSIAQRQVCWAHLLRQFRGFQDLGPEAAKIGRALEVLTETMFHYWHRVRDGTDSRAAFQALIEPLRKQVVAWLQEGQNCSVRKVAGRCREILALEPALWTFVETEGVEPTNNAAERALRPAVLWRKRSFGTNSSSGSLFVGRILTVVTTLRLQRRNVLDYLTAACQASLDGRPAPSLLPD
jgi:transposase